ncbi:hypothetical protein GN958_ATG03306, partial [Phytophthora infestans]
LSASPPEHPLTVTLRGTERIEALLQLDTQGPCRGHVVDSQPTLSRLITKELQSSSILHQVRPHPRLGRLTCLRAGGRRSTRTKLEFKLCLRHFAHPSGATKAAFRITKWTAASPTAAAALCHLKWKKIRRVVGLGPSAIEHAIFSMEPLLMPAGVWRAADKMYDHHITLSNQFMEAVTMLAESCWRLGGAILLQRGWR